MNFSNTFKIVWWSIILLFLTIIGLLRFSQGQSNALDVYILVFWFILVLLPLISEISLFGVSVKKDIASAKEEIKSYIASIKNDIQNHNQQQQVVNINTPTPAKPHEYDEKVKEDAEESSEEPVLQKEQKVSTKEGSAEQSSKENPHIFKASPSTEDVYSKMSKNEKVRERIEKIKSIEKLVTEHFVTLYEQRYRSQMKLENESTKKDLIVDGLLTGESGVKEIIEIKYITQRSFENFYYIAGRFIKRVEKFGLKIPIRFVVISEDINEESTVLLKEQIQKLNFSRIASEKSAKVYVTFFKLQGEKLIEV